MIDGEKFERLKRQKARCPYGRDMAVGSSRCENCRFHRVEALDRGGILSSRCEGNAADVPPHDQRMRKLNNPLNS